LASVITPERFTTRLLDLPAYPMTKPGRDSWFHEPEWRIALPGLIRGNPNLVTTAPVRAPSKSREAAIRDRAALDRREQAFWAALLENGIADMTSREFTLEEATWLHLALVKAQASGDGVFRLRNGRRVAVVRAVGEEVSAIRVPRTGTRLLPAFHLESQR
jgi:hypothetical protein